MSEIINMMMGVMMIEGGVWIAVMVLYGIGFTTRIKIIMILIIKDFLFVFYLSHSMHY